MVKERDSAQTRMDIDEKKQRQWMTYLAALISVSKLLLPTYDANFEALRAHFKELASTQTVTLTASTLSINMFLRKIPKLANGAKRANSSLSKAMEDAESLGALRLEFLGDVYNCCETVARRNEKIIAAVSEHLAILKAYCDDNSNDASAVISRNTYNTSGKALEASLQAFRDQNERLRSELAKKSVLDVLQQSSQSLASAARTLLTQIGSRSTEAEHALLAALNSVEKRAKATEDRGSDRDWNKEFQQILGKPTHACTLPTSHPFFLYTQDTFSISDTDSLEDDKLLMIGKHADRLCTLAKDFVSTAKMYGKIIIQEVFIPYKEKTIKPIDIGGVAGGVKYVPFSLSFFRYF